MEDIPMLRQALGQAADAIGTRAKEFEGADTDDPDAAAEMTYLAPRLRVLEKFFESAASMTDANLRELGAMLGM